MQTELLRSGKGEFSTEGSHILKPDMATTLLATVRLARDGDNIA